MELLKVANIQVDFETQKGNVTVLRDLSFKLNQGEALGLVGESGSGKSVTSLSILQVLSPNAKIVSGEILFEGKNLLKTSERDLQKIRGSQISMIFQDPMSSLNPCYTIGDQLFEVLRIHENLGAQSTRDRALSLLQQVGIPDPVPRLKNFPHEMSGGMSQRIMIAMAMASRPKLLIADEPTTALDVTIQAQILALLRKLRKETMLSLILVSHDLGVISENTDRVMIMYAGEIVEEGLTSEVISNPKHPYTSGLLGCLPGIHIRPAENFRLPTIAGTVLNLQDRKPWCQFEPRCYRRLTACREGSIPLIKKDERKLRCINPL